MNLADRGSIPLGHPETKGLHSVPWIASSRIDAVCGLINEEEVLGSRNLTNVTRACSWESSQPPKLTHGVRILTLVLRLRPLIADVARMRKASAL